ncbi:MAG TPA: hypothetical protein VGR76_13840, partial [Candidatus Angelobacter sp.]|nr:hypothetical protein [Candidatus Angelobacter sp.]
IGEDPSTPANENESRVAKMDLQKVPLQDILKIYESWSKKTVWLHAQVDAIVSIPLRTEITVDAACTLIEEILLACHGFECKHVDEKTIFVDWTPDPKFKKVREEAEKAARKL